MKDATENLRNVVDSYGMTSESVEQPTPVKLFDITCVVGSIYAGGDMPPRIAAFMLIGAHSDGNTVDSGGTYTFPSGDGKTVSVTVSNMEDRD